MSSQAAKARFRKLGERNAGGAPVGEKQYVDFGPTAGGVGVSADQGYVADFRWWTGGKLRWIARNDGVLNTGGEVGSNWGLASRNDDGTARHNVMTANRQTGIIDFYVMPTVGGVPLNTLLGGGGGGSGESVIKAYTQAAHGFSVGMPVYRGVSGWAQTDRDSDLTPCDAVVSVVTDANTFTVTQLGLMTLTTAQWDARTGDTGGLSPGEIYWTHTVTGGLTKVQPTSGFAQQVGRAESATVMRVAIGPVFALADVPAVGGYTYISTQTITGAAATSVTFSGLDLSAHKKYYIEYELKEATGAGGDLQMLYNGDTVVTNYQFQYSSVTLGSGRFNSPAIGSMGASACSSGTIGIQRDINNFPVARGEQIRGPFATIELVGFGHMWNNSANVTSITLRSSVALALAVGSTFRLYRLGS